MVRSKTSMTPKSGSAPLSFLCESDYRARAGERKIIKPSKQWLWRLLGIGVRINLRARLLASCSQHYLLHTWEWHLYFSLSTQDIKSFSLDYPWRSSEYATPKYASITRIVFSWRQLRRNRLEKKNLSPPSLSARKCRTILNHWRQFQIHLRHNCSDSYITNLIKTTLIFHSEKAMAPHSSTLAWKTPWTEEPGRLQSMGSLRVRHDWVTSLSLFTFMHWRRKWQPIPVFLPGESQGQGSLVGCRLWGCTESDTT